MKNSAWHPNVFLMRCIGVVLGLIADPRAAVAAAPASHIEIRADFSVSDQPLTTERAIALDPAAPALPRRRWLLARDVKPADWEVFPTEAETEGETAYGVRLAAIASHDTGYLRSGEAWFPGDAGAPPPCARDVRFATREGARRALEVAQAAWASRLRASVPVIEWALRRVRAPSPEVARAQAGRVFALWLAHAEQAWRAPAETAANDAEWKFYASSGAARSRGARCRKADPTQVLWRARMDTPPPPRGREDDPVGLLARAPARLWGGLYSIRLTLQVGETRMVGSFLIDPRAPVSIVSPNWLMQQGIGDRLIGTVLPVRRELLTRAFWSPALPNASPSGARARGRPSKTVVFDRAQVSELDLPSREFLLAPTEFFDLPRSPAPCCDGVLGADQLARFAVEFVPGTVSEVRFRQAAGYGSVAGKSWTELALRATAAPGPLELSGDACQIEDGDHPARGAGVDWDLAQSAALVGHFPRSTEWRLVCDGEPIYTRIPAHPGAASVRGTTVGMGLLGLSPFTLDLPHGRLWFDHGSLLQIPGVNRSGLQAGYGWSSAGNRVLRVRALAPRTGADALRAAGLRPGMELLRVGGQAADKLDEWDIERLLTGTDADQVEIAWPVRTGKAGAVTRAVTIPTRTSDADDSEAQ